MTTMTRPKKDAEKKIETRRKLIYEPIEKRLVSTEKKIKLMLQKIQQETDKLDIEWFTLKALAEPNNKNTKEPSAVPEFVNVEDQNNEDLDDVNRINAEVIKVENVAESETSESESEMSDIEQDEHLMNIFI